MLAVCAGRTTVGRAIGPAARHLPRIHLDGDGDMRGVSGWLAGVGLLAIVAGGGAISVQRSAVASTTYAETAGGVANTWTNPSNAGGIAGAQIPSNATVQISCKTQGFRVADGNTNWYLISSGPWNGAYWVSADAFYNNGATAGSLLGTPYVDPAVPDCSTLASATPQVTLTQGPAAPAGYRYAITLANFAANSAISVTCYDSVSPSGFYSFTLSTDGSGSASTAAYCYSGDGPDHWVIANGVASNHVTWGGSIAAPPPPGPATVGLSQGSPAPAGYWYAITLTGFAAGSSVTVTCFDSVSPSGFQTFTLTTNGSGAASTSAWCYSGDGPDHWVTAGSVTSNHVTWGGSSIGGGSTGGGSTGGGPSGGTSSASCTAPTGAVGATGSFSFDNMSKQPRTNSNRATDLVLEAAAQTGVLVAAGPVSFRLLQHYLGASGSQYTIAIDQLMDDQPPLLASFIHYLRLDSIAALASLEATPPASCATRSISSGWVGYTDTSNDDWHYALRSFGYQLAGTMWIGQADASGRRPVRILYRAFVADTYNFNASDATFGRFEQLARDGWAADFRVVGQTATFTASTDTFSFNANDLGIPLP